MDMFLLIILINLTLPFFLIILGGITGTVGEILHWRSIKRRERIFREITLTNWRRIPSGFIVKESFLCGGNIVVGSDYMKTFLARLKTLVGGRLFSLERLMMLARAEALLRMAEDAYEKGADYIINVRFETMFIRFSIKRKPWPMVEVVAYGTAVRLAPAAENINENVNELAPELYPRAV